MAWWMRGGVTSVTVYGITFNFERATNVSYFWNGDPCVPPGTVVTSVTPAWDGTKNGTMLNPTTPPTIGHDTRFTLDYSAGARQTFPVSLADGDRLVHAAGVTTPNTSGGGKYTSAVAVLTCLATGADPTMFRPAFSGTGNSVYSFDDINTGLILTLTNPVGKTAPTYASGNNGTNALNYGIEDETGTQTFPEAAKAPFYNFTTRPSSTALVPCAYWPVYASGTIGAGGHATLIGALAMKALIDHSEQTQSIYKMIQLGIDLDALAAVNDGAWVQDGGHGWGRKWPILYKRLMFGESEATVPYYKTGASGVLKFKEDANTYLDGSTGRFGMQAAYAIGGYDDNHDCRPSAGNLDQYAMKQSYLYDGTNPNDEYRLGGDYEKVGGFSCVLHALAARKMNSNWLTQHPPFFAYMDRWADGSIPTMINYWENLNGNPVTDYASASARDAFRYGGTGNGWAEAVWSAHR